MNEKTKKNVELYEELWNEFYREHLVNEMDDLYKTFLLIENENNAMVLNLKKGFGIEAVEADFENFRKEIETKDYSLVNEHSCGCGCNCEREGN